MMVFAVGFWEVVRFEKPVGCSPHDGICVLIGTGRDFSGGSEGKELRFDPWVGKIPCRNVWQPTVIFLPIEFHGQRIMVGYNPRNSD